MTEDLSGGWLGTYWYQDRRSPCRFEATLIHTTASGRLGGTVVDDGGLGGATVGGSVTERRVTFTKAYLDPSLEPVEYEGTVAEDGRSMAGTWVITRHGRLVTRGTWEMHRMWTECEAEAESREEVEVAPMPIVRVEASVRRHELRGKIDGEHPH